MNQRRCCANDSGSFPSRLTGTIAGRSLLIASSRSVAIPAIVGCSKSARSGIWCEILKLDRAGIHDNFFELGGHSLLATQLVSRIRQTFDRELPLRAIFEQPTVAGMAALLDDAAASDRPALGPVSRDQKLPLSFA